MNQSAFCPEGMRLFSPENEANVKDLSAIEAAMAHQCILEGTVLRCDPDLTLTVTLGNLIGYVTREEVALCREGEEVREIAAITRVGKAIAVVVTGIQSDERGIRLTLSRRRAQQLCAKAYLSRLRVGDIIPARVTHMEQFGAFVDIGCGIVSLLSIDCISVSRISHPRDRLYVGEDLRVVVKSIDPALQRIYVSLREMLGTWEENAAEFSIGQTVGGVVRSVEDYGIFVELTPNLAGLAEYREGMTPHRAVSVYVKNIIPAKMKIKLVIIEESGLCVGRSEKKVYIPEEVTHMDMWRYSPKDAREIGTVFAGE